MCVCVCVCIITTNLFSFVIINWPLPEFNKRALYDSKYNTLYYMNNQTGNFRMFWWIDNDILKRVSNVHMGTKDEAVMRPRKRQRLTNSIKTCTLVEMMITL